MNNLYLNPGLVEQTLKHLSTQGRPVVSITADRIDGTSFKVGAILVQSPPSHAKSPHLHSLTCQGTDSRGRTPQHKSIDYSRVRRIAFRGSVIEAK